MLMQLALCVSTKSVKFSRGKRCRALSGPLRQKLHYGAQLVFAARVFGLPGLLQGAI